VFLNLLLEIGRSRWMRCNRYELKVVLLHLWHVNVKTTLRIYLCSTFSDFAWLKLRHNNITSTVDRPQHYTVPVKKIWY
jgi:hypothetical protein